MILPFAAQHRGENLRDVVKTAHERAGPKAVIDYAFHLIVSDPTENILGQELPALIMEGYTSFKVYLTYEPAFPKYRRYSVRREGDSAIRIMKL